MHYGQIITGGGHSIQGVGQDQGVTAAGGSQGKGGDGDGDGGDGNEDKGGLSLDGRCQLSASQPISSGVGGTDDSEDNVRGGDPVTRALLAIGVGKF